MRPVTKPVSCSAYSPGSVGRKNGLVRTAHRAQQNRALASRTPLGYRKSAWFRDRFPASVKRLLSRFPLAGTIASDRSCLADPVPAGCSRNGIGVPEPAPRPRHPRPNLTRDNSRMPTIAGGSQYTAREYELTSGGDVPRRRTPRIPCRRLYRARIQQPSQVRPAGALVSIPARATHTVSDPLDLGFLIQPLSRVGPTRDPACTRHEPYLRCPTLTETETTSVRRKDNRPGS